MVSIGNKSVPKTIINDTVYLFFKTAISILLISNHNSFRELFDKIVSVYFIYRVGQKTALFFRLDNFVTFSPRKACSKSKFSKFYPEKGTKLVFQ